MYTLIMACLLVLPVLAQTVAPDSIAPVQPDSIPREPGTPARLRRHQLVHAYVFAGWAATNLLIGGIGMFFTEGQWHHFHHMNAAWGSINLIIAVVFWRKSGQLSPFLPPPVTRQKERALRRFLAINLGLDLLYTAVGLWLWNQAAGSPAQPVLLGFGQSICLQGVVLLSIDLTSFIVQVRRLTHRRRKPITESGSR